VITNKPKYYIIRTAYCGISQQIFRVLYGSRHACDGASLAHGLKKVGLVRLDRVAASLDLDVEGHGITGAIAEQVGEAARQTGVEPAPVGHANLAHVGTADEVPILGQRDHDGVLEVGGGSHGLRLCAHTARTKSASILP